MNKLLCFQDILATTQEHIDVFARAGLRTLTFAFRELDESEVEQWIRDHTSALMVSSSTP